ncbi:MAG: fibronectin type III domain-containing protein [Saprospiraceae bacterium]
MNKRLYLIGLFLCLVGTIFAQRPPKVFENNNTIDIPDIGAASNLYPSVIEVSGVAQRLSFIRVSLYDVLHYTGSAELDILLETPNGTRVVLASDLDFSLYYLFAYEISFSTNSNLELTAASYNPFGNVDYKPGNKAPNPDNFPIVGNIDQPNPTLSGLENINPNGIWKLYVVGDSLDGYGGNIRSGWSISFFEDLPICSPPTFPTLQTVSDSNVVVNLAAGTAALNWEVAYGIAPFAPTAEADTANLKNLQPGNLTIHNLTPQKNYQLYIRSVCADSIGKSKWVGPLNFTTRFYPCKYARSINLCERVVAPTDLITGYKIDACVTTYDYNQQLYRFFKPLTTSEYWIRHSGTLEGVYYSNVNNNCETLQWRCGLRNVEGHFSLGTLSKDSTYIIMFDSYLGGHYDFNITACPAPNIALKKVTAGPFWSVLKFEAGYETKLSGKFDIFYTTDATVIPDFFTSPTQSALNITDGEVKLSQLTPNTTYQFYIRSACENGNGGCWQGPFVFKTEPYCGDLDFESTGNITSSFVEVKWKSEPGIDWQFLYRRRSDLPPVLPPDPWNHDFQILDIHSTTDTFSVTFHGLNGNSEYEIYAQASCGTSNQPFQGPFYIQTNALCFAEVFDLYCEQRVYYSFNEQDQTPVLAKVGGCGARINERLYRFKSPGGLLTIQLPAAGGNDYSNLGFYIKSASSLCDVYGWNPMACRNATDTRQIELFVYTQKDSTYYLLLQGGGVREYNGYYEFYIQGCENACKTPQNITVSNLTSTSATLNWAPSENENRWEIQFNGGENDTSTVILEGTNSFIPNELLPSTTYQVQIRSLCGNGGHSAWATTQFTTSNAFNISLAGKFNHNHPFFVRPGGEALQAYFYEQINFSVANAGSYHLEANVKNGGGNYLLLYEAPFDKDFPNRNLITSKVSSSERDKAILDITLQPGKEYVLIATTKNPMDIDFPESSSKILITGNSPVHFISGKFNGLAPGPYGTVAPLNGNEIKADYLCIDKNNWMHFYNKGADTTSLYDDELVLSIEYYYNFYLYSYVKDSMPRINGFPGASKLTNPPANYVINPTGWFVMNRFWDYPVTNFLQPDRPLKVRFYFTHQDFTALQDTIAANGGNAPQQVKDIYFYKINDYNNIYDPNPALGHTGVPAATAFDQDGYWEYAPGDSASTQTWALGRYNEDYYAEMVVKRFSGGGGGLAGNYGGGALTGTDFISTNNDWNIYPNPFSNSITIESKNENNFLQSVKIADASGKIIYQKENLLEIGKISIDLPNVPIGFYFLLLESGDSKQIFKLIKK